MVLRSVKPRNSFPLPAPAAVQTYGHRALSEVIYRDLNSHALCVRHTHFMMNSRSHAYLHYSHAFDVQCLHGRGEGACSLARVAVL